MRYLSCFSGIGGLEASDLPEIFCEMDPGASAVLARQALDVPIWDDIRTLRPPAAEVVAGGWPCQDVSIAGKQEGLKGLRSGLLWELLRVANAADAHTVVAENVTNLLRMRRGAEFRASLEAFHQEGFPVVGWRVLNAREFGLPQHRSRLLIIASRHRELVEPLFRPVVSKRPVKASPENGVSASGFYWTAGIHSINYTLGYVPTIKIGSSLGIASPPAVHYGDVVRVLSADEALALQGFDLSVADFPSRTAAYKAAGNAVARDLGRWVLDGVAEGIEYAAELLPKQQRLFGHEDGVFPRAGISFEGVVEGVAATSGPTASNLADFLDLESEERLSSRAAAGLLRRLSRSQQPCPPELRTALACLRDSLKV